jgi:hypothetical protein
MRGAVASIEKKGNAYEVLIGKPEGKRSFVIPQCRR